MPLVVDDRVKILVGLYKGRYGRVAEVHQHPTKRDVQSALVAFEDSPNRVRYYGHELELS